MTLPAWLNSNALKTASGALVAIAALLVTVLPTHTVAHHIAAGVVAFGAAHGVVSTGVEKK